MATAHYKLDLFFGVGVHTGIEVLIYEVQMSWRAKSVHVAIRVLYFFNLTLFVHELAGATQLFQWKYKHVAV